MSIYTPLLGLMTKSILDDYPRLFFTFSFGMLFFGATFNFAAWPLALLFTALLVVVLGSPLWMPFEGGFLAGYLAYDMTHFYLHHHRPTSRLGRRMRELHMRHHFQDDTTWFGVSAPWWDQVFRTAAKRPR